MATPVSLSRRNSRLSSCGAFGSGPSRLQALQAFSLSLFLFALSLSSLLDLPRSACHYFCASPCASPLGAFVWGVASGCHGFSRFVIATFRLTACARRAPLWPLRLFLTLLAFALWAPSAAHVSGAHFCHCLPRSLGQKPLDACDRVVLGWDFAFARRAAHDPPGSRRDACSCKP